MAEVKVKSEDLSGLGWTIKSLIDSNMEKSDLWENIKRIKGTLVVKETDADVDSTVIFDKGNISIQNGAIPKPTARVAANFDALSELTSGQIGPIKALLTGKIKAGGNLLKLLIMAKAIIHKE
jgi:putative sterol carrier protein